MIYCYIRISTEKQDYIRQENILKEKGYIDGVNCKYFTETYTGKTKKRPVLLELMGIIQKGDTIVATELSRISRSVKDFNNLIDDILKKKQVNIYIIKENFNLLANGNMDAMTRLILNITSSFAEFERDLISDRTKEALKAIKERGTKSGEPIGRPRTEYSTKENLISTLEYMIENNAGIRKASLKTRYPLGTLKLEINKLKGQGIDNYRDMLKKLKED